MDTTEGFALGINGLRVDCDSRYGAGIRQVLKAAGVIIDLNQPFIPQRNVNVERPQRPIEAKLFSGWAASVKHTRPACSIFVERDRRRFVRIR